LLRKAFQPVPARSRDGKRSKQNAGEEGKRIREDADVKTATPLNQQASKPSKQSQPKPQWLHVKNLTPSQQPDQHRGQSTCFESRISPETVQVDGVIRVWGTLRGCSSKTVLMLLQRLSTVAENVEVCHKYKKNKNNTVQWWFLIRGEETVLQVLQQERERIQLQTSWKLERCHRPVQSDSEQTSAVFNPKK